MAIAHFRLHHSMEAHIQDAATQEADSKRRIESARAQAKNRITTR